MTLSMIHKHGSTSHSALSGVVEISHHHENLHLAGSSSEQLLRNGTQTSNVDFEAVN